MFAGLETEPRGSEGVPVSWVFIFCFLSIGIVKQIAVCSCSLVVRLLVINVKALF